MDETRRPKARFFERTNVYRRDYEYRLEDDRVSTRLVEEHTRAAP